MTFLETLWQQLYAQSAAAQMLNRYAAGFTTATSSAEAMQAIADEAAAFADDMCTRTPAAGVAALEVAIAALKAP